MRNNSKNYVFLILFSFVYNQFAIKMREGLTTFEAFTCFYFLTIS